jgi:hypothetical protein
MQTGRSTTTCRSTTSNNGKPKQGREWARMVHLAHSTCYRMWQQMKSGRRVGQARLTRRDLLVRFAGKHWLRHFE